MYDVLSHCFLIAESVDSLMGDTHELGGSAVVVDRATPKVVLIVTLSL